MPTGYTAKLMEHGEDFRSFALRCAKNFGACVTLRDDDMDTPIPVKFEASDYHLKQLAKVKAECKRLLRFTKEQQVAFGLRLKNKHVATQKKWAKNHRVQDDRLEVMTRAVEAWNPPSPDHVGMKTFMLDQLKISRNDSDYWDGLVSKSEARSPLDYFSEALTTASGSIKYHTEKHAEECERVAQRNRWIQQLRESLA